MHGARVHASVTCNEDPLIAQSLLLVLTPAAGTKAAAIIVQDTCCNPAAGQNTASLNAARLLLVIGTTHGLDTAR
jgi:hypothetical protein